MGLLDGRPLGRLLQRTCMGKDGRAEPPAGNLFCLAWSSDAVHTRQEAADRRPSLAGLATPAIRSPRFVFLAASTVRFTDACLPGLAAFLPLARGFCAIAVRRWRCVAPGSDGGGASVPGLTNGPPANN